MEIIPKVGKSPVRLGMTPEQVRALFRNRKPTKIGWEVYDLNLMRMKVERRFDPLRSDPRFDDLVKRLGLQ